MIENASLWLVVFAMFALMAVAYEGGLRLHHALRPFADGKRNDSSDESHSMAGVFGLLALLLAFAFGLALNRYEERRNLVTSEASAISTFASRLELLPAASRDELRPMLNDYARARLAASLDEAGDLSGRSHGIDQLHGRLESQLYAVLAGQPADTRTSLLVQSFDALDDVATERQAARAARLPGTVVDLLALYCIVGALMLGYAVAATNSRHRVTAAIFFALLAFAFATILDLDRPRGGLITVPQDLLEQTVSKLAS
jgi:hypothetical protein